MKKFRPGPGFTVFLIFFGIAVLEAVRSGDLKSIAFWFVMGLVFILLDISRPSSAAGK